MNAQIIDQQTRDLFETRREQVKVKKDQGMAHGYEELNKPKGIFKRRTYLTIVISIIIIAFLTLTGAVPLMVGYAMFFGVYAIIGIIYGLKNHPIYSLIILLFLFFGVSRVVSFNG